MSQPCAQKMKNKIQAHTLHQTAESNYKISIDGCFVCVNEHEGRVRVCVSRAQAFQSARGQPGRARLIRDEPQMHVLNRLQNGGVEWLVKSAEEGAEP